MRPRDVATELDRRRRRLDERLRISPSLASTVPYDDEPAPSPRYAGRDPDADLLPGTVIVTSDEPLRAEVREIAEHVALLLAVTARLAVRTAPSVLVVLLILCASALVGASTALVIVTLYLWGLS